MDARDRGIFGRAGLRDHASRTGRVVNRHGLDPERGQELLALGERLPMGSGATDVLQTRPRHAQERVVDPDHDLTDDPEQRRVLEELVGLVHRPRLRVLQRNDAEGRLAAGHPGEHEPDAVARERLGVGERPANRTLAVGAGFSLVGDLHGRRA